MTFSLLPHRTLWSLFLLFCPLVLSAEQSDTLLQKSIDELSGKVQEGRFISPSRQIDCHLPETLRETPQVNSISDNAYLLDESVRFNYRLSGDSFVSEWVMRLGIGSSPITEIDTSLPHGEQLDQLVSLIQRKLFKEGLQLDYRAAIKEERIIDGMRWKLVVLDVRFMDSHQHYGQMVALKDQEAIVLHYMPTLVSKTQDEISTEAVKQALDELSNRCNFGETIEQPLSNEGPAKSA